MRRRILDDEPVPPDLSLETVFPLRLSVTSLRAEVSGMIETSKPDFGTEVDMENAERQLAAERRSWVFETLGSAQATLMDPPERELRGTHFVGDSITEVLDLVEAFDKEHGRLPSP